MNSESNSKNGTETFRTQIVLENYLTTTYNKLLRMHWSKRSKEKKMLSLMVLSVLPPRDREILKSNADIANPSPAMVNIHYTRYSRSKNDADNLTASFKLMGDALKGIGLIRDDSEKYITLKCVHVVSLHSQTKLIITF